MVFVSWHLCINIYTCQDINIILYLLRLRRNQIKTIFATDFCFYQKKTVVDTELFLR